MQNRLKAAQLISELGGQTMNIVRTEGDIQGLRSAKAANPEEQAITALRATPAYRDAMQRYGTGSDMQKAAQAVTGALSALATGNLAGAAMNGAMPYLATEIKNRVGEESVTANAMAHAVLGAVTAELNNLSALADAVGAGGGELAARVIAQQMFPDKDRSQLSESEKQQVSTLSQLAAGLAGALTTSDTAGAITAAQTGKSAIENNYLTGDDARAFEKEWTACQNSGGDCGEVADKYTSLNANRNEDLQQICADSPLTCASYQKQLVENGMDAATRPEYMPDWFGAPVRDKDVRAYVQSENAQALEHINQNTSKLNKFGAFVAEPENILGLAGTAKSFLSSSATVTAKATGAGMSLGANAGMQIYDGKKGDKFDYTTLLASGVTGAAGVGKSLNSNVRLNVGGAYLSSQVNGEDSQPAIVGAAAGSAVGYGVRAAITRSWEAKIVKEHFGMSVSKNALKYSETAFGPGYLFKETKLSPIPGIFGGIGAAATQEGTVRTVQKFENKE